MEYLLALLIALTTGIFSSEYDRWRDGKNK